MFDRIHQWFGRGWIGIAELLMTALCVFLSLSIHEFAHGFVAYKLGDNTAKSMGRLNLSPMSHLDPVGAICLFLFGFGWARPVPITPGNFKIGKRKSGMVWTSLAGPLSNLLVAFLAVLILNVLFLIPVNSETSGTIISVIATMMYIMISTNIGLAVFNIIPIPPLDGSKILSAVLPSRIYFKLMQYERYGFIALIILINLPIFSIVLNTVCNWILSFYFWIIGLIPFF